MQDITIRDMKAGEVETLVDIALVAWEPIYVSYREMMGEALFAACHPDWRAEKAAQIRSGCDSKRGGGVLVVEAHGQVIGFATYYANVRPGVGEIGNNAVRPGFQGRGVGTLMYEEVFRRLRALGMRFVRVGSGGDPSHAPARRAYEKVGFHIAIPGVVYYREL